MSLARRERRALAEIENKLRMSDPLLDAMLAHGTAAEGRMGSAPATPWWRRFRTGDLTRILVIAVGLVVVICLAAFGVLTTPPARSAGHGRQSDCEIVPACTAARGAYP